MAWVVIANLKGAPGDAAALGRFEAIENALDDHQAELTRLETEKAKKTELAKVDAAKPDRWDPEVWQKVQTGPHTHVLADVAGRVGLGVRKAGAVVDAPGGVDTPRAGTTVDDGGIYGYAIADKSGRISELAIGKDGRFPAKTLQSWGDRMGWGGGSIDPTATKTAGVALTLPDTITPATDRNNISVRLPILLGATAVEWRVHIRNYNDKSGTAYAGALAFTGVYVGKAARAADGTLSGTFATTPTAVANGFNTNAAGNEWISDWVTNAPLQSGTDYLLSYGYTSATQDNYLAAAGCWTTPNANDAGTTAPAVTQGKWAPLDVWIEVRVPAATPINMYLGDSLTLGIQATLPVYDSWAAKHAVANGAIHSIYAIGGSQATDWLDTGARRLNKWLGLSKPSAAIVALGNNDMYSFGASLAEMKQRTINVSNMLRNSFTDRLYLTTVLPRIGADQALKDIASAFNDWCLQTPAGARESFDFYERIANANGDADLKWASTSANFHLSTAGYARCAAAITHRLA